MLVVSSLHIVNKIHSRHNETVDVEGGMPKFVARPEAAKKATDKPIIEVT